MLSAQAFQQVREIDTVVCTQNLDEVHLRLSVLQRELQELDGSDEEFGLFARGLRSCVDAENTFADTVRSWEDVGTFLKINGFGWLMQNLCPDPILLSPERMHQLIREGREFAVERVLQAPKESESVEPILENEDRYVLIEERRSPNGYRGGYSWCAKVQDQWCKLIVLCGEMSPGQRSYALAHEHGHVQHFTLRKDAPSWRVLESAELFNEAIADAFAFFRLKHEGDQAGLTSMMDEWSLRIDDLERVYDKILSSSSDDSFPSTLDDLHAILMPAFAVFSTIALLDRYPTPMAMRAWLHETQHPLDDIRPILNAVMR